MGILDQEQTEELGPVESAGAPLLARELTGNLPCARCRYNLKGLSVRSACPECGTPVRGTLLTVIDPHARELQPIDRPRLRAVGLMVWSLAGLLAALGVWLLRFEEIAAMLGLNVSMDWLRSWVPVLVGVSGLGAATIIRPHRSIPSWKIAAAALGFAAYLPLTFVIWRIHWAIDGAQTNVYFGVYGPNPDRTDMRLIAAGLTAISILGIRPIARLYVSRSLLMRSGRVDRQTLLALVAALAVGAIGDLIHKFATDPWSGRENVAVTIGSFMIGVGGLLFTLGLVGVVIDSYRLLPVILSPPLSATDVLGFPEPEMGPSRLAVPPASGPAAEA